MPGFQRGKLIIMPADPDNISEGFTGRIDTDTDTAYTFAGSNGNAHLYRDLVPLDTGDPAYPVVHTHVTNAAARFRQRPIRAEYPVKIPR